MKRGALLIVLLVLVGCGRPAPNDVNAGAGQQAVESPGSTGTEPPVSLTETTVEETTTEAPSSTVTTTAARRPAAISTTVVLPPQPTVAPPQAPVQNPVAPPPQQTTTSTVLVAGPGVFDQAKWNAFLHRYNMTHMSHQDVIAIAGADGGQVDATSWKWDALRCSGWLTVVFDANGISRGYAISQPAASCVL